MAFDDFGLDLGGFADVAGSLTDLPVGGLASSMPLPDFSSAAFFPGEGMGTGSIPFAGDFSTPGLYGGPGPESAGGGGFWSTLGAGAQAALPFARLGTGLLGAGVGLTALNRAGQQQSALDQAQRTSAAAAAPGVAAAGELIPAGTKALLGGPLPPDLEAQVTTFINNEKMKARQLLAKMGLTTSSAAAQVDSYIEQQAQELRAKLASGLLTSGTGAIPPGVTGQAGPLAAQQSDSISRAIAEAQRAMFSLLGQQG